MTKATLIKVIGTVLAGGVIAALPMVPPPYHDPAVNLVTLVLGWLHIPRPGDVKAGAQ
jgi:hypothetical protein